MNNRILHKRSLTPESIPNTSSLELGEIAINVNDGRLYFRQSGSLGEFIRTPFVVDNQNIGNLFLTGSIYATETISGSFIGDGSQLKFLGVGIISGSSQISEQISGSFTSISSSFAVDILNLQNDSSSFSLRITSLENFSSSLNTTFATDLEVSLLSSSIASNIELNKTNINLLTAETSSYLLNTSDTFNGVFEVTGSVNITGSLTTDGDIVGNLIGTALTSSYIDFANIDNKPTLLSSSAQIASDISGAFTQLSGSINDRINSIDISISASQIDSASFSGLITINQSIIGNLVQATGSYLLNTTDTLDGDLTVTGRITAQEFYTEYVSSSVLYESGSTKFGDTLDDIHQFTGSLKVDGGITASLFGLSALSSSLASRLDLNSLDIINLQTDSSSFSSRVTSIEDFSSSLNDTFATDNELLTVSASLASSIESNLQAILSNDSDIANLQTDSSSLSSRVTSLEDFSSSLNNTFATDSELSSVSSSLASSIASNLQAILSNDNDITNLQTDSSSLSSRVTSLEDFSSSLNNTYATDTELSNTSASLASSIESNLQAILSNDSDIANLQTDSSSFSTRITVNENNISNLTAQTSSYLLNTTDTFNGTLEITGSVDITGSLEVNLRTTTKVLSASYIDLDVLANGEIPQHQPGRIFYGSDEGALQVYNDQADITLQVGQEFFVRVFNGTASPILNGTPVRISGSQGDRPKVYPALAEDHSIGPVFDNHIIGVATHDIPGTTEGYITAQGLVRGVNTNNFNPGDILFLQTGSAGFRNDPPPFPYDVVQIGYVTRKATNGFIFVEPKEPVHFSNISGLSGSYQAQVGDLWVFQSNNSWTHTNVVPNIKATGSFSGSFSGSLVVETDLLPFITNELNLGSPSLRFKDLYLSGSTIYLGNILLQEKNGNFTVSDISGNNIPISGTIIGTISTASYVTYENIDNKPTLFSGSVQVDVTQTTNYNQVVNTSTNQTIGGEKTFTGDNTFEGTQTFNNLVVNGTGSFALIQSVTGSAKVIGDAFLVLNSNTPSQRYSGIVVYDSGSDPITTASLFFDGLSNDWNYEYKAGGAPDYAVVMFGPEYSVKGTPTYLTDNRIPKAVDNHHLNDSNISDDGTTINLGSNTTITGTVTATGTTILSSSYQIESDISGAFKDASSSLSLRVSSLEEFSSSLDNTFATDLQLQNISTSLAINVASNLQAILSNDSDISTLQTDVNNLQSDSSSFSSRVTSLEEFSSSLNSTFATDSELSSVSSSLASSITSNLQAILSNDNDISNLQSDSSSFSSRVTSLEEFSSSLNSTFATDAEVSNLSASIAIYTSNNLDLITSLQNGLTSSLNDVNNLSSSLSSRITSNDDDIALVNVNFGNLSASVSSIIVDNTVLSSSLSSRITSNDDDISLLSVSLSIVSTSLNEVSSSLSSRVTSNDSDILDLQNTITDVKIAITGSNNDISTLSSSLSSRVTSNDDDIVSLFSLTGNISSSVSTVDNRLTQVSSSVSSRITSNDSDILDLQNSITDVKIAITGSNNNVTTLSSSLSSRVTSNDDDILSLFSLTGNISSSLTTIDNELTQVSSSISSRITSNDNDITILQNNISSLTTVTGSYLLNTTDTLTGDLTVTGKITAQEFHTEFVSSSIIFESGSTKFGDSADDIHQFTGSILLNSSGKLGIGIIPSSYKVDIYVPSGAGLRLQGSDISNNALFSGVSKGLRIGANTTSGFIEGVDYTGVTSYQPLSLGGSSIRFTTNGINNEKAIINTAGNLGINTSTPPEKLTVEGNISGSGNLTITGNSTLGNTTSDIHTVTGSMSVTGSLTATRFVLPVGTDLWATS